jgi:ammonia channel protein AmtB
MDSTSTSSGELSETAELLWLFVVTGFCFLGLLGYNLLEYGIARYQYSSHCLLKSLIQLPIGMAVFWLVGYAFAFGDVDEQFIGKEHWAADNVNGSKHHIKLLLFAIVGMYGVYTVNGCIMERA